MDSKRKSGGSVGDDIEDRAAKRRKIPSDHTDGETPETTSQHGFKLLEIIKRTEDKNGRRIAQEFLTLPPKRSLPDYYQVIKMPIALDTVEGKVKRREFANLTALESYLKRMCQNAKEYNEKGSVVSDDAERIRKAVSNYMVKNNPAYKTKGYTAQATPIPNDDDDEEDEDEDADMSDGESERDEDEPVSKKKSRAAKIILNTRSSITPALSESDHTNKAYEGLNLQQAQEKILEDLLHEKELPEDDFVAFADFVELPPRSLKDYYRRVKNPISLLSLQKRVKGIGKKSEAGVSEFKSWNAFEDEASYLWKNAYFYNEDGSEIFVRAQNLEKSFQKYLAKAKQAVPGPKIKLKLAEPPAGPKITLKLGTKSTDSPATTPAPQPNGSSEDQAKQNGTTRRNPFSGTTKSSTPGPKLDQLERAKSGSIAVGSPSPAIANSVKNEDSARNSPAGSVPNDVRSTSQTSSIPAVNGTTMPPPSTPGLGNAVPALTNGSTVAAPPPVPHINPSFESKWRQPGQEPLISNLMIETHPGLNIARHFHMDLPPHPNLTHQSVTINLPHTHYYIQIKPKLVSSILDRQHRMFITCGSRLTALPLIPGHPIDPRNALYECRLHPGVNRIEIELIAALPQDAKPINGQDYELEKITVYANLMKS